MRHKLLTSALALLLLVSLTPLHAGIQESPFDDIDTLIQYSDIIIRGHVQRVRQEMRSTQVLVGVDQVFKGNVPEKALVITHRGGKFLVDQEEPSFQTYDQAILYLIRDGDSYKCLHGSEGKKTILNNNVYLHPDNHFVNMKVDKYVEQLTLRIEEIYPQNPNIS